MRVGLICAILQYRRSVNSILCINHILYDQLLKRPRLLNTRIDSFQKKIVFLINFYLIVLSFQSFILENLTATVLLQPHQFSLGIVFVVDRKSFYYTIISPSEHELEFIYILYFFDSAQIFVQKKNDFSLKNSKKREKLLIFRFISSGYSSFLNFFKVKIIKKSQESGRIKSSANKFIFQS